MKHLETIIEERKERFVRNSLMSDEFLDFINKNKKPIDKLMSYYQCAIMEVETKFKVLNEQYSLEYDRNPIEDIKSRVKSMDSLIKKIRRKDIPITIPSIEENIHDIAGVRIICSFPDDIYIQKSSSDYQCSNFPAGRETKRNRRSTVAYDCHGFLGKPGAQTAL